MSRAGYCSVCRDPARLAWVAEQLRLGRSGWQVAQLSREPSARDAGVRAIAYPTVLRHVSHIAEALASLPPPPPPPVRPRSAAVAIEVPAPRVIDPVFERVPGGKPPEDVATLVQTRAMDGIRDGTLRVTTQHGLSAQKMLDLREDKRRDRELALNVARMLSGAMPVPAHLVIDVTPRAEVPDDYTPSLPVATDQTSLPVARDPS